MIQNNIKVVKSVWIFCVSDELITEDDFIKKKFFIKMFFGKNPCTFLIFTNLSQFIIIQATPL
jgi:hypothetical protein